MDISSRPHSLPLGGSGDPFTGTALSATSGSFRSGWPGIRATA